MVFACFHFYNITGSFYFFLGLRNIIVVIKLLEACEYILICCVPVCLSAVYICITKLSIRSNSSMKRGGYEIGYNWEKLPAGHQTLNILRVS